jgi:hypothetical protein
METPNNTPTNAVMLLQAILERLEAMHATMVAQVIIPAAQPAQTITPAAQPAQATTPAAQPAQATTPASEYTDFMAETIIMNYSDDGKPTYKIQGKPFNQFGIRVYPEVLETMGINIETLKPGPNPITGMVRALKGDKYPKKVVAWATNHTNNDIPF